MQLLSAIPITMIKGNAAFGSCCVLHNSAREGNDPVETCNSYIAGIFHSFALLCVVKYNFPKHVVLWFHSVLKISFLEELKLEHSSVYHFCFFFFFKPSEFLTFPTSRKDVLN